MTGTTDVTVDAAKDTVKKLADKDASTTNSDVRYLAYGARLRTALRAATRDVGYESYKVHRRGPSPIEAVNFSEPTRIGIAAVQRATFQSIASMFVYSLKHNYLAWIDTWQLFLLCRALPALTIHTAVAQAKKAFKNVKNVRLRTWGPTATGLAIVPILPYLYDHPVEQVTERAFDWIREKIIESNKRSQLQEMSKSKTEL
ncbi:hypothetical protein C0993_002441 [Termitomyces sp. T159_Od127]|nr:hypothetical protein C0993_002441 [Termitomyces sp. T159_Od127]